MMIRSDQRPGKRILLSLVILISGIVSIRAEWGPAWDSIIVAAAVAEQGASFDENVSMVKSRVGPEYRYHTNLRDREVHPTRDSFRYAHLLLAQGGERNRTRAIAILKRLLSLQDTLKTSDWYGLWGYYLEEPADKMSPADWNWADFNGATLIQVHHQHRSRLPKELAAAILRAIRHAGYSVMRRNVDPHYTNIAVMGTYVTLAAGELLNDQVLWSYATERLQRLAQTIDQSGSFFEYNSPTYGWVSIANLSMLRMFVKDSVVRRQADRIHYRVWQQLALHWHPPTRQLAGPLCRAYYTDIGKPAWMQKALGGRLQFAKWEELRAGAVKVQSDVALVDVRCPADLESYFLRTGPVRQHREMFSRHDAYPFPFFAEGTFNPESRTAEARPVQGTTYLTPFLSLGSANRCDFWVQRRALVAYWGDTTRPLNFLQVRFVKDDYDFASAMFYSAQNNDCVLGVVGFRSEGGDKHLTLDPVRNGAFTASRLYLQFIINAWNDSSAIMANGKPVRPGETPDTLPALSRIVLHSGGAQVLIEPRYAVFGNNKPHLRIRTSSEGQAFIELYLMRSDTATTVAWADVNQALAAFRVRIRKASGGLAAFDALCAKQAWSTKKGDRATTFTWTSPAGKLEVSSGNTPQPVARLDELFDERVNGTPIPVVRLSDEKLAR